MSQWVGSSTAKLPEWPGIPRGTLSLSLHHHLEGKRPAQGLHNPTTLCPGLYTLLGISKLEGPCATWRPRFKVDPVLPPSLSPTTSNTLRWGQPPFDLIPSIILKLLQNRLLRNSLPVLAQEFAALLHSNTSHTTVLSTLDSSKSGIITLMDESKV
jgi:hypothetical protein